MAASTLPRWSPPQDSEAAPSLSLPPVSVVEDKFPFCLVWGPLPVIGWLVPFVGHMGICRSDGTTLDFAGSFFINVGRMAFGSPTKYIRLSPSQACLPESLSAHTCQAPHAHQDYGTSAAWDEALTAVTRQFQHEYYNIFTSNCHSFVSCCLNRMAYRGRMGWTIVHLAWMVFTQGTWVSTWAPVQAYAPFFVVMALGIYMAGWFFFWCWGLYALFLIGWFLSGTFLSKKLVKNF